MDTLNGPAAADESYFGVSLPDNVVATKQCNREPCWNTLYRNQIDQIIEKRLPTGQSQTSVGEGCSVEKQLLLKYLINEQNIISLILSK